MLKKCFIISALGVFLLVPTLPAKTAGHHDEFDRPEHANPRDGAILGTVEGALSFCSKVDSHSTVAISYKQMDQFITSSVGAPTINELRSGDPYEDAYQKITKTLKALSDKEALSACNGH